MELLNQTRVKISGLFDPMLQDLQANIIEHHGRMFAFHLLLHINDRAAAKTWITRFAQIKVTSALQQLQDSERRQHDKDFDGGTVFTLSLSVHAYTKLHTRIEKVPDDEAFREGMKNRANRLRDDVSLFEAGWKKDGDIFIIVADSNEETAQEALNGIMVEVQPWSTVLATQRGKVLRNSHGISIEHFGYADGVSQPLFSEKEISRQGPRTQWNDEAMLSILLKKDAAGTTASSFGSYLVYRKLEQNVRAFKEAEEKLIAVKTADGGDNEELAGAMIVGRFEDGTEVVNSSEDRNITTAAQLNNNFDYSSDPQGVKCPFHAHIRIANPRKDVNDFSTHRITRRGIPFNDIGRNEENLKDVKPEDCPEGGVGLLFMCYQAQIPNQFEFIQHFWANNGDIDGNLVGQDGIIGQGPNDTERFLPVQWGQPQPQPKAVAFKNFVTTRGGDYFFTPSISGLQNL